MMTVRMATRLQYSKACVSLCTPTHNLGQGSALVHDIKHFGCQGLQWLAKHAHLCIGGTQHWIRILSDVVNSEWGLPFQLGTCTHLDAV